MLDLILILLICILGLKGIITGLIRELFGLVGIVGGVLFASFYSQEVGEVLRSYAPFVQSGSASTLAGFSAGFLLFWLASYFIGATLRKILKLSRLGYLDSIAGAFFGAFKIFFIFGLISYAAGNVDLLKPKVKSATEGSFMYPVLYKTGSLILSFDDDGKIREKAIKKAEEVKETIKQKVENEDISPKDLEKIKQDAQNTNNNNGFLKVNKKAQEGGDNDKE